MSGERPKVIIVPGINALPWRHWFQSLMAWLRGYGVVSEALWIPWLWRKIPIPWIWARIIRRAVQRYADSGPIYLVGHSIASLAILRYLADSTTSGIAGVVLVAPVATSIYVGKKPLTLPWPWRPVNPQRVEGKVTAPWVVVCSADDPIVPQPLGAKWYERETGAELIELIGCGHFCDDEPAAMYPSGLTVLPQPVLDVFLRLFGLC